MIENSTGKLRLMMLDDAPSLREIGSVPTLGFGFGKASRRIVSRNFRLEWLFDEFGANAYFQSLMTGRAESIRRATPPLEYAHIVLFDYRLTQSQEIWQELDSQPGFREAVAAIDPLGEWGTMRAYSGRWKKDRRVGAEPKTGFGERSGCQLGTLISLANSGLPSVGIPQTVTPNSSETAALEWVANITLRGAFNEKEGALADWMQLFEKALPRLRKQILYLAKTGLIAVDLKKLLEAIEMIKSEDFDVSSTLTIESGAGFEQLRLEAICFDLLYELTHDGKLLPRTRLKSSTDSPISFLDQLSSSTTGNQASVLGKAIELSDVFQRTFESQNHIRRRDVSREVYSIWGANSRDNNKNRTLTEDTVDWLKRWGVNLETLEKQVCAGEMIKFNGDNAPFTLRSLKDEARGQPIIARYAALSLAIYTEKVRAGLSSRRQEMAMMELLEFFDSDTSENIHWPDLDVLRGVWLSDEKISYAKAIIGREKDARSKLEELRDCLGSSLYTMQHALGLTSLPSPRIQDDEGNAIDDHRSFGTLIKSNALQDVLDVYYSVAAPSPPRLLMWSERKTGQASDVNRPLDRLEDGMSISPTKLFSGVLNQKGSLQPGEGRIITMLALHHSFARQYWPDWMIEGEQL